MNTRLFSPLFSPVIMAFAAVLVPRTVFSQQDSICDFNWYSNLSCPTRLECADDLAGQTKTVPANVTRISEDGLTLCLDIPTAGIADVVYIMDLSGSMHIENFGGDPYGARPAALQAAFDYHVANTPESRIGYIGFAGNIVTAGFQALDGGGNPIDGVAQDAHLLEPVTAGTSGAQLNAQITRLQSHIDRTESLGGTNYRVAINQAIAWFNNDALTPHERQAIVFFSDGFPFAYDSVTNSPYPTADQIAFLTANNIAVYGIFMGSNLDKLTFDPTELLRDLSEQTGGAFYTVDPDSAGMLAGVVAEVVQEIARAYTLESVTVTAGGVTANLESAVATDSTWDITLDGIVPLSPGANQVSVNARFSSDAGSETVNFTLTVNVAGSPDPYCVRCRPITSLQILTIDNQPLDVLSSSQDSYKIRLTYYGFDTLETINVMAVTSLKGDTEVITISRSPLSAGGAAIYEAAVAFRITDGPAVANGETEAASDDVLTATWAHPVDTRDNASATASVSFPRVATPVAAPAGAGTPYIYYGSLTVVLTCATGPTVTIRYTLDGSEPTESSPEYTGPIVLDYDGVTTIKAKGYLSGLRESLVMTELYDNKDNEGPRIVSALYFIGNPPGSGTNQNDTLDTLIITFNEPVKCDSLRAAINNPADIFNYYFANNTPGDTVIFKNARFDVATCDTLTTLRILLPEKGRITPDQDQVQIDDFAITDQWGNKAPQDGARTVVRWGRSYDLIIDVTPNPGRPGHESSNTARFRFREILESRSDYPLPSYATIIRLTSIKDIDIENSWVTIYDALGNPIREKLPVYRHITERGRYYIAWDYYNSNRRLVGSGSYLASISVRYSKGGSDQAFRMIGFNRRSPQ